MTHTYKIHGMTCQGCRHFVEKTLQEVEGVEQVTVDLEKGEATIAMKKHLELPVFQKALEAAGGHYSISLPGEAMVEHPKKPVPENDPRGTGTGKYYCPMQCEGNKKYPEPGSCPVCGMDLVEELSLQSKPVKYTCPMHPEISRDEPGHCPICGMDLVPMETEPEEDNKTYRELLKKFRVAVIFTLPVFLIAMADMWDNNPLHHWLDTRYWIWIQFVLSLPVVLYATWMFFQRAYSSIVRRSLNMFTLIGIGAGAAWIFSVAAMLFPNFFPAQFKMADGNVHVYFEATTVILTLVLLGQVLEARAHGQTNSAIRALLKLAPNKTTRITNGKEEVIPVEHVHKGDLLRIKPGEKIPVDGVVEEGESTIDESMISGEPMPVYKSAGDWVRAGTINGKQSFVMSAEKIGSETLLAQIIQMVNEASRSRAPIQKIADRISAWFVPIVIIISVMTFILWAVFGPDPALVFGFINAIAVLIIACPCAIGLATPMSVMVGVGKGAQSGILIKNAEALEKMNEVDTLIIDKTGTLTEGKPSLEKVVSLHANLAEAELIRYIISVNQTSEHPLAAATLEYGKKHDLEPWPSSQFKAVTGKGVIARIHEKIVAFGNEKLMQEIGAELPEETRSAIVSHQEKGKTVPILALDKKIMGFAVIGDALKKSSGDAIKSLQEAGLQIIMLTGDNAHTAEAVAGDLQIDYRAEMLPEDKLKEVQRLQSQGKKVAMAGDGINDAPALAKSDVGIAMGTGTDVAIESAGITLVKGDLQGIVKARNLSRKVMKNIRQNLFFALIYNTIGVPIAAGVLFPFFGILLSPMIAALAMSFSSVSVITNALRLRAAQI